MSIYVIEEGPNGSERSHDLMARLLKDRIIYISQDFSQELATSVTGQLLYLESIDNTKDIHLYVNSPGGEVSAAYAIYDVMSYIKPDVSTICFGRAYSAASFILAAGAPGKRFALPNASIMIHELSAGYDGKYNDVKVAYTRTQKLHEKLANDYVKFTKQPLEKILKDMERDFFMSAEEAKEYGLIDKVQYKRN